MIRAVLLDLDDTLLSNDMDRFMPVYLRLLATYAGDRYPPELLVKHLIAAAEAMATNVDPTVTNEEAFWSEFSRLTGLEFPESRPFFERFYETLFDSIQTTTAMRPEARPLVKWALSQGHKVAIATNPMFPLIAVQKRLAWAGIADLRYDLITSYENMHFTKPHAGYYEEILDLLNCQPAEAIMVGDDWERDIAPAGRLGIHTFWITDTADAQPDGGARVDGQGTLSNLLALCGSGWLGQF